MKSPIEMFVVKHYSGDERPTLKGNGFDGLELGGDREEAQAFVDWLNTKLRELNERQPASDSPDFVRRTNEDYAAWCRTYYQPEALDDRGMMSLHGLWAWQEQERRRR